MKKLILTLVFAISVFAMNGQSFNGVPIAGDLTTTISRFKAKGFVFKEYFSSGAIMRGKVSNENLDLYIITTPKSKKVCKFVLFLNEDISWTSLKYNYNKYVEILTNKYGVADDHTEQFITPYFEGDGYELQAVGLEKATYMTYWLRRENMNVAVEISKYKQVKLTYENVVAMEVKRKEQEEIDANAF